MYFSPNKTQVISINQLLSAEKGDPAQETQPCCSQSPSQQHQPHFKAGQSKVLNAAKNILQGSTVEL